jgi:hypothetical protein
LYCIGHCDISTSYTLYGSMEINVNENENENEGLECSILYKLALQYQPWGRWDAGRPRKDGKIMNTLSLRPNTYLSSQRRRRRSCISKHLIF